MFFFAEYDFVEGTATFKEICNDLDIPYRRTSDVLNGMWMFLGVYFLIIDAKVVTPSISVATWKESNPILCPEFQ